MTSDNTAYRFLSHTDYLADGTAIKSFGTNDYIPNTISVYENQTSESVLHRHPNIEMKFIIDGELKVTIGKNEYISKIGDFYVVNSNEYHGYKTIRPSKFCTIIFDIDYISNFVSSSEPLRFLPIIENDETIKRILTTLIAEYFERPIMYSQHAEALFHELIIHMVRNYMAKKFEYSPVSLNGGIANAVNDFLSHNFIKKLSIDTIADTMGFNRHYMMRAFKKETGMTIAQQLHEIRLRHSANLMRYTAKSVADVALLSGFESQSTFSKAFKEKYGIPPLEYRNNKE